MATPILMIAYFFPPLGMGGVQRMMKLAKYLPRFGFDVHVLTVKDVRYPAYDETLLSELPESVTIHRSGSTDPARVAKLVRIPLTPSAKMKSFAKNRAGMWPDAKIGWRAKAAKLGCDIVERFDIRLLLSSSPPVTAHLVAMDLHEKYGLPWIADFRDIWESRPPEELYTDSALVGKSYALLEQIAGEASITGINETICRKISSEGMVIPGGFDEEDFEDIEVVRDDNAFTLCYLGSVGPLHPLEPFFVAARQASNQNPVFAERVRFHIIGANDDSELRLKARAFGLESKLILTDYVPHRESLKTAANCSITIMSVPSGYDDVMTGKIFDYIGLPIPTLAAVPRNGEAAKLIAAHNGGIVAAPDDTKSLAEGMLELFRRWQSGAEWKKTNLDTITRSFAAGQFAKLMDGMIRA